MLPASTTPVDATLAALCTPDRALNEDLFAQVTL
jgi:hypothetical protein